MMLDLSKSAKDFLDELQPKQFKQITSRILELARNPYPHDAKHLSGHAGYRRIDVGEFRACYKIAGDIIQVTVVNRRNDDAVYKELNRK